jgi:RNA polymerase sigma-70 factor (ECF subfamily)
MHEAAQPIQPAPRSHPLLAGFLSQARPEARAAALLILRNSADVEDVVQDALIEAWMRRAQFDASRGSLSAWLSGIVRSRALDRIRSQQARLRHEHAAGGETEGPAAHYDSCDHQAVRALLAALGPDERRVLELTYFLELTQHEIARRTGLPIGTVKTHSRRGLQRLTAGLLLAPGTFRAAGKRNAATRRSLPSAQTLDASTDAPAAELTLSSDDVARVLAISATTLKRHLVAGRLVCGRSSSGARAFSLESLALFHRRARPFTPLDSSDARIAFAVQRMRAGASLARVFDELLPKVERDPSVSLEFIERAEPLARVCRPRACTALVFGDPRSARVRMAAVLLRGVGFQVPALPRDALEDPLRFASSLGPSLAVVVGREEAVPETARRLLALAFLVMSRRLLIEGRTGDFTSLEELCSCATSSARPASRSSARPAAVAR